MPKRHFHTFDALRFFAFLKVFLLHLPLTAFPVFNFLKAGGGIGVQFFFVLSGFLITYIILEEKERKGNLNLKKFFARRFLRIWPLYFLAVAIAYLTPLAVAFFGLQVSNEGYVPDPWFSFTFLENYKMLITGRHPNVSPLTVMWSLCIEEHFYLIWGLLLYFCKPAKVSWYIGGALLVANLCKVIFIRNQLPTIDILTNFDLFAYGALPAYFFNRNPERFEAFFEMFGRKYKVLFLAVLAGLVLILPHYQAPFAEIPATAVLGLAFALLLCQIVPGKGGFKIADSHLFSRLGLFTYGLYVYHTLVITGLLQLFKKLQLSVDEPGFAVLFAVTAFGGTLLISVISYYSFERPFLKLKKHFY